MVCSSSILFNHNCNVDCFLEYSNSFLECPCFQFHDWNMERDMTLFWVPKFQRVRRDVFRFLFSVFCFLLFSAYVLRRVPYHRSLFSFLPHHHEEDHLQLRLIPTYLLMPPLDWLYCPYCTYKKFNHLFVRCFIFHPLSFGIGYCVFSLPPILFLPILNHIQFVPPCMPSQELKNMK